MQNRRQHFRQSFSAPERLPITLHSQGSAETIHGEVVNLSIGGVRIESVELTQSATERWSAEFSVDGGATTLRITVAKVYVQADSHMRVGFRFLPSANLAMREEQEKAIWRYLLEVQRSERRRLQEKSRLAG